MQSSFLSKLSSKMSKQLNKPINQISYENHNKTYQFWKGRNRFLLNGNLIFGPPTESIFVYIFLIFLAIKFVAFYFFFIPNSSLTNTAIIQITYPVCTFLFLIFYILTAIVEPGYLPHQNLLNTHEVLNLDSDS